MIKKPAHFAFFAETNPAIDEWTKNTGNDVKALGIYGASGWCLIGLYVIFETYILPKYFALVIFNRGFGIFWDDVP